MRILSRMTLLGTMVSVLRPPWCAAIGAQTTRVQTTYAQTYQSPRGVVDVIGLHRWTVAMLRDSLSSRRPGLALEDAACMRVLREELGFPDASVDDLSLQETPTAPERHFVVVKVVEPGDSARARWRTIQTPAGWRAPAAYDAALAILADSSGALIPARVIPALQQLTRRAGDTVRGTAGVPPNQGREMAAVAALVREEARPRGRVDAAAVLRHGTLSQRMLAAAVLPQFAQYDEAWEELVMALRDPAPNVREVARVALGVMPARAVKWTPRVVPSFRALLAGTNVAATESILGLLANTKVQPAFARQLLRNNGDWILLHLAAANPVTRETTRHFLVQVNGGIDVSATNGWAHWLARL